MFFFPLAMLAGAEISPAMALSNLFWVTLGNLLGGAGGVALAYRYAYLGAKGGTR
jgi:formate/nitrite transporter FocA (FNT family)